MNWNFVNNTIQLDARPKSTLKITGTRLGTVLGINPWSTPFLAWCEITKLGRVPITDTKYIDAGKAIEPKQIEWTKSRISEDIHSPDDFYGSMMNSVRYDFYKEEKRFGGMWDAKVVLPSGKVTDVVEYKTTKRSEDWNGKVPLYYLAQVLLYGHLEGAKRVHLVVSFVTDKDYAHPEKFEVTDSNTQIFTFDVATTTIEVYGTLMTIKDMINYANEWWEKHIETGTSPEFDERKDKQILDIVRSARPEKVHNVDDNMSLYRIKSRELERLKQEHGIDILEKELDALKNGIKEQLISNMGENDKKIVFNGFQVTKTTRKSVDTERLKTDGLYESYLTTNDSYTLKVLDEELA